MLPVVKIRGKNSTRNKIITLLGRLRLPRMMNNNNYNLKSHFNADFIISLLKRNAKKYKSKYKSESRQPNQPGRLLTPTHNQQNTEALRGLSM